MTLDDVLAWVSSFGLADATWLGRELAERTVELIAAGGYALVRATGVTVRTGHHGLKFSFGRVKRVVGPGFHVLVPGLQSVREVPTRARTVDLEAQRVVTLDGLVYDVDTSATWRIVDLAVALVEVDDLDRAMADALAVTVHDTVRTATSELLADAGALDRALTHALADRCLPWGVTVEVAGFSTFTPTPETLRITQLARAVGVRRKALGLLVDHGMPPRRALALIGAPGRFRPRGLALRREETLGRWRAAMITAMRDEQGRPEDHIDAWEQSWREQRS